MKANRILPFHNLAWSILFFILLLGVIGFLVLFFVFRDPIGPQYSIQDLGMLGDGPWIRINNLGHVAYSTSDTKGQSVNLWRPGQGNLVVLAATEHAQVHDMSEQDLIVGSRTIMSKEDPGKGHPHAFVWSATNGLVDLALEDELRSWAYLVREDDRVLGVSEVEGGSKTYVIWESGGRPIERHKENILSDLSKERAEWISDPPSGIASKIKEKSGNGWSPVIRAHTESQVVGWLMPIGASDGMADRVSSKIQNSKSGWMHEVLRWMHDRTGLFEDRDERTSAFVWRDNELIDLNEAISGDSGWDRLLTAVDINDHGQIAGVGMKGGRQRLFLLTPIGTPVTEDSRP